MQRGHALSGLVPCCKGRLTRMFAIIPTLCHGSLLNPETTFCLVGETCSIRAASEHVTWCSKGNHEDLKHWGESSSQLCTGSPLPARHGPR